MSIFKRKTQCKQMLWEPKRNMYSFYSYVFYTGTDHFTFFITFLKRLIFSRETIISGWIVLNKDFGKWNWTVIVWLISYKNWWHLDVQVKVCQFRRKYNQGFFCRTRLRGAIYPPSVSGPLQTETLRQYKVPAIYRLGNFVATAQYQLVDPTFVMEI